MQGSARQCAATAPLLYNMLRRSDCFLAHLATVLHKSCLQAAVFLELQIFLAEACPPPPPPPPTRAPTCTQGPARQNVTAPPWLACTHDALHGVIPGPPWIVRCAQAPDRSVSSIAAISSRG